MTDSAVDLPNRAASTQGCVRRTEIFFWFDDGELQLVSQSRYSSLLRRSLAMPSLARRRVRVADWYVEDHPGEREVSNETYSVLYFDETGVALNFPDAAFMAETKSLHAGSTDDPYQSATRDAGQRPRPPRRTTADNVWTPTASERRRMRDALDALR